METWDGATSDDTDAVVLHRFFHKHADKIGKELLSLSKPTVDGESSVIVGKRAWDSLCALLVDLGPPMDAPHLSTYTSSYHREYLELMSMYANHSTASVEDLFLETEVQVKLAFSGILAYYMLKFMQDNTAVFILRLSKIDVENLDVELFMYHILKVCRPYPPGVVVLIKIFRRSLLQLTRRDNMISSSTARVSHQHPKSRCNG